MTAATEDTKTMQSNPAEGYIALTCPQCGKHYKKVPLDAIRKYQLAFCKVCNTKFRVDRALLQEAAEQITPSVTAPIPAAAQPEPRDSGTADTQPQADAGPAQEAPDTLPGGQGTTMPAVQSLAQEAAAAADGFGPEPEGENEAVAARDFSEMLASSPPEAWDDDRHDRGIEEKLDALAETLDDTFGQTPHDLLQQEAGDYGNEMLKQEAWPELPPELYETVDQEPPAHTMIPPQLEAAEEALPGELEALAEEPAQEKTAFDEPGPFETPEAFPETAQDEFPSEETLPGELEALAEEPVQEEAAFEEPGSFETPEIFPETARDEFPSEEALPEEPLSGEFEALAEEPAQEEAAVDEQLLETSLGAETEEALLDEEMVEEQPLEAFEQYGADMSKMSREERAVWEQIEAAERAQFDAGPASGGESSGGPDVSKVLKDLVLPATTDIEEGMEQFVMFALGEHTFAGPIADVVEIGLPPDLTMVPNTPPWILGIANMRGDIISVVDLRGFLAMDQETYKKTCRMIVVQTQEPQMAVGLIVDRIRGIRYFPVDDVQPSPPTMHGQASLYVNGTCMYENETVSLFDFQKLLQSQKMRQFQ